MRYLMFLLLFFALSSRAQVWEDFSDGDLTSEPTWTGELEKFKTSSSSAVPLGMRPALQLDSEGEGGAFLCLDQGYFLSMQWEFWVKMSFNTSSSNYSRVYLSINTADPGSDGEGYFVQAGGTADSVWFGRRSASGDSLLACLPVLFTGNSTNAIRMKILRDPEGLWTFYGDPTGESALIDLGSLVAADTVPGRYFILSCHHTSSNASKFYFDDIYCGPQIVDSTGPILLSATIQPPSDIRLVFNEAIDGVSASDISHYLIVEENRYPYDAFCLLEPSAVMIFFNQEFEQGRTYTLSVGGLEDWSGNAMDAVEVPLSWYRPGPYDVIINEIMADPTPVIELPEHEYIELFNRTSHPIDLTGWVLTISGNSYPFETAAVEAGGYLLLMEEGALLDFKFCGPAYGFSSFSIPNSGAEIILRDTADAVMCHTLYSPMKFGDPEKENGGWSLERIDPSNPCFDEEGWIGSTALLGGTPGKENAALNVFDPGPSIRRICCLDSSTIRVSFNQCWKAGSLEDASFYQADHMLGQPISATIVSEVCDEVDLAFGSPIPGGWVYELQILEGMNDCCGRPGKEPLQGRFSLPERCLPFDVIFNEILFQPLAGGSEYIELYNRSGKTIYLDELSLAYIREVPPNPPDTEIYAISAECLPLFPAGYIVLAKEPDRIMEQFYVSDPSVLYRTDPFPSLNNDEGRLLLLDQEGNTVDGLDYSQQMQYPLLNSFAGVALERIYPDVPGTGEGNWHSASSGSGFGTPGYQNSQYIDQVTTDHVLEVYPKVFSPNGDGNEDVLGISCHFDEPGMLVAITIFSEDGRIARRLVNTSLGGAENSFSWDGLTDGHYPAPDGIYIVLLECVSMEGYSRKYKKAAGLISH